MNNDFRLLRAPNAPKNERVKPPSLNDPPVAPKRRTVRQPKAERLRNIPRLILPETDEEDEKTDEDQPEWAFLREWVCENQISQLHAERCR